MFGLTHKCHAVFCETKNKMPSSLTSDVSSSCEEKSSSPTSNAAAEDVDDLWDSGQEWILIFDRLLKHPRGRAKGCRCDICLMDKHFDDGAEDEAPLDARGFVRAKSLRAKKKDKAVDFWGYGDGERRRFIEGKLSHVGQLVYCRAEKCILTRKCERRRPFITGLICMNDNMQIPPQTYAAAAIFYALCLSAGETTKGSSLLALISCYVLYPPLF